jgi:hypothetical protein
MIRSIMGLALGCARCHAHKFDPVPTDDYYAMAGIFHSTRTADSILGDDAAELGGADALEQARVAELRFAVGVEVVGLGRDDGSREAWLR